jgi:hypothetical protein
MCVHTSQFVSSQREQHRPAARAARRHRWAILALAMSGVVFVPGRAALAAENVWSGVSGVWSGNAGWSQGTPPANGDSALITNPAGAASTITFDPTVLSGNLGQFTIDNTAGGSITVVQTANTLTSATTIVGSSGSGAFQQTGGNHNAGNLFLGFLTPSASGTFSLGGPASLSVGGIEVVGYNGSGTLNQTGGNHSVGGTFFAGINAGSSGVYNLTGGSTTLGGDAYFGQSESGSLGTLNLSGSALLGVVGNEFIGNAGVGVVHHTAGGHAIDGNLYLGNNAGASGSYALGNSASLAVQGSETLGSSGSGTFTQTGGSHSVAGSLYLAFAGANSSGRYTLSGPSSTLNVAGTEILGYNGSATVNHSDGAHSVGTLIVGVNPGASGTYNLSDSGSLTVIGPEYLGYQGGAGTFNQTGGNHSVGGVLTIGANPASTAIYNLSGGNLSASVANNGTLNQSGGVFNGTLNNYGAFNYGGGTFAGSLVLQPSGVATFNTPFTSGGGITVVNSAISVGASSTLTANGAGLNIQGGTLLLSGGSVGGDGPIRNGGQITGNGTFGAGGLTNTPNGTVSITSGPTTFAGAVVNNGSFSVQHATATFAAGLTNNAIYMSDPSTNSFTDLVNGPSSYIQAAAGDQFQVTGSFRSSSTQNTHWDTHSAALYVQSCESNTTHSVDITGKDIGATLTGYVDNFAWGTLQVDPNQTLLLQDGNADPGGALYVGVMQLLGAPTDGSLSGYISTTLMNVDAANPMNLYYDPSLMDNAYLNDQSYALGNGGILAPATPVPEPPMLGVIAVAGLCLLRRRARANRKEVCHG